MTAISVAIVGKSSEPLYVKQFFDEGSSHEADLLSEEELFGLPAPSENNNESSLSNSSSSSNNKQPNCSLRQQFILHAALDRFEQLDGPPPGFAWRVPGVMSGADAMFVGLLCPVEDMRVYGYMTTTHIKFLLVVQEDAVPLGDQKTIDETIKRLFLKIHRAYVEHTLNPFCRLEAPIVSTRFDAKVTESVAAYNRTRM